MSKPVLYSPQYKETHFTIPQLEEMIRSWLNIDSGSKVTLTALGDRQEPSNGMQYLGNFRNLSVRVDP